MLTSTKTCEVFKALAAFQDEVGVIPKGDDNPFFKSKYAGLPTIVEKAQPILRKHGLVVIQTSATAGTLTTRVAHPESDEWFESECYLQLGEKVTAQAQGSATTYARRYEYVTALGLICDEDDDGNAVSVPEKPGAERATRKPRGASKKGADTVVAGEGGGESPDAEPTVPPAEVANPEGWGDATPRQVVLTHNALAERIGQLDAAAVAACVKKRDKVGWPMPKKAFDELTTFVIAAEQFTSPPPDDEVPPLTGDTDE